MTDGAPRVTHPDDLDAVVRRVASTKAEWAALPLAEKSEYLKALLEGALLVAERWAEAAARAKGLERSDPRAGEEWLSGPMPFVQNVRLLIDAFAAGGAPKPAKLLQRDGRKIARVFPLDGMHRLVLAGTTADVWIKSGEQATQGAGVKSPPAGGRLSVVLGAGNISAIPAMDALYKLFAEGHVVVLKMNPVNAAIGSQLEVVFRRLIEKGYFAIIYGGVEVGATLVEHPAVDALHVTGSDATYEAIVFGADPAERARRKAAAEPKNPRPFTAELGSVTPVILVPGPYSLGDLEYQARHVAAMLTHNGGFNCDAAQVLVVAREWLQRSTFIDLLRKELAKTPPRHTWAAGAAARRDEMAQAHVNTERLGAEVESTLQWTLVPRLEERHAPADEPFFRREAFCGALAIVEIEVDWADPVVFLERAVRFANERLWGTLAATLLVHPATLDDHEVAVDRAVRDLRYGSVCVNTWPGVAFALAASTWGAYPGHVPTDIQSGAGVVHNALLFDHPEKTVVRAPFKSAPPPPYFANLDGLADLGRALTWFEADPTWSRAIAVARAGLRVKRIKTPEPKSS